MPEKNKGTGTIVISAKDILPGRPAKPDKQNRKQAEPGSDPDHLHAESIQFDAQDIGDEQIREVFEPAFMREFIGFVHAGLPQVYLKAHPKLKEDKTLQEVRERIIKVPDPALRNYLISRFEAIERYTKEAG